MLINKGIIYIVENKISKKFYIGKTINFNQRKKAHKNLRGGARLLNNAIKKYGLKNFIWKKLEKCKIKLIDNKEKYYIKKYNTMYPNGYNLTSGGGRTFRFLLQLKNYKVKHKNIDLKNQKKE